MIGQRLVFGFKGAELPQEFIELVREFKLGNVILFRYNVENTAQLRRLCAEIQELVRRETGHPAFITIDQEGGMVTRLPADAVNVPGSMAIAATGRVRDAYDCAGITARQLRGIGVNFNLAPDLDVNSNSMNPVIGVRSFGDDAARVAELGAQAVRGRLPPRPALHRQESRGAGADRACAVPRRDRGRNPGDNEQPYSVPADRAVGRAGDDEPPHHARYPARRAGL